MSPKPFKSLKVCVIGPVPPPAGGMANQTAELCRLLRLEQAQVTLVATNTAYRPTFIGHIRGLRALFRLIPYLLQLRRALAQADIAHLMANSGWSWHLFAAPAIWIAHWLNTPLVLNYRGGHAESFCDSSWRWIAPSMARVAACIVPSSFLAEVFSKRQIETQVIPNTLNSELFFPPTAEPQECRNDCDNTASDIQPWPIIAITRNLEHIYGIDLAIRAMPAILIQYPQAQLLIAGSGSEQQTLQSMVQTLEIGSHVEFCGRLERQQIADLYRSADLMLNPSRIDNSPNSIIEALGSGLPVVSSRAGGIPNLVSHGETAYLVETESVSALADATLKVLGDSEFQQSLRDNGIRLSQRFHWQQVKADLLGVYQQAQGQSA